MNVGIKEMIEYNMVTHTRDFSHEMNCQQKTIKLILDNI